MSWSPGMKLEAVEQICIEQAYKFYKGNKTQTATALGITTKTLDKKLEKYNADREATKRAVERQEEERRRYLERSRGLHRSSSGVLLESVTPAVAATTVPLQK